MGRGHIYMSGNSQCVKRPCLGHKIILCYTLLRAPGPILMAPDCFYLTNTSSRVTLYHIYIFRSVENNNSGTLENNSSVENNSGGTLKTIAVAHQEMSNWSLFVFLPKAFRNQTTFKMVCKILSKSLITLMLMPPAMNVGKCTFQD